MLMAHTHNSHCSIRTARYNILSLSTRQRSRQLFSDLEDGALALDILGYASVELRALLHAHLGCEGGRWPPLGRGTRGGLLHHLVDLLERQTLHEMLAYA
jgi:hypothetical protein